MSIIARRNWALRLSIVMNVCVLLYVCAHLTSGPWIEDASSSNWVSANAVSFGEAYSSSENVRVNTSQKTKVSSTSTQLNPQSTKETSHSSSDTEGAKQLPQQQQTRQKQEIDSLTESKPMKLPDKATETKQLDANNKKLPETTQSQKNERENKTVIKKGRVAQILTPKEVIQCKEKSLQPRTERRGDYWVLYNYVPMSIAVKCWETVTYTTHADYTFLDNLEPLLERWRAPVSIALHAPGTDFQPTLDSIKYARSCGSSLIAQLTTFHVYFSSKHVPKVVPRSEKVVSDTYNCSLGAPWSKVVTEKMYKNEKKILYPVNVGRNVARDSSLTHYVLASDIELYPNPDLPVNFLNMIVRRDQPALDKPNPKVFVLPIFEIAATSKPPKNKTVLLKMLKNGTAIEFHKKVCSYCHSVPKNKEWQQTNETESLHVFHVGKRTGKFAHWEPIFIGTNLDPLYEERLSWEGKSDKMTQGYALCVFDYDFLILDNAFLVHRPGIKIYKKDSRRDTLTSKTNMLISKILLPELKVMYGTRKGCAV